MPALPEVSGSASLGGPIVYYISGIIESIKSLGARLGSSGETVGEGLGPPNMRTDARRFHPRNLLPLKTIRCMHISHRAHCVLRG